MPLSVRSCPFAGGLVRLDFGLPRLLMMSPDRPLLICKQLYHSVIVLDSLISDQVLPPGAHVASVAPEVADSLPGSAEVGWAWSAWS